MNSNRCIIAAVALWACSGGDETRLEVHGASLVFAEDSGTGCVTPMSLHAGLPSGVERMVVRVVRESDGQVAATQVITSADLSGRREVLITGVPEGTYRLLVTVCRADDSPVWGGRSATFSVSPGFKSAPIVYLTRAGALNCVGGKNQNPLQPQFDGDGFYVAGRAAFQGAVRTAGGRVFVTGGFTTDEYRATGDALTAGRRVWEFHPETGVFTGVFSPSGGRLEIAEPRAAHGMVSLKVGGADRLVLAGGVASAVLGPAQYPVTLAPLDNAAPVKAPLEVVTIPAAGTSEAPSARPLAVTHAAAFPSLAFSPDGRTVVLAGGKEKEGVSSTVTMTTLSDAALDQTAPPGVRTGTMAKQRFGAAAAILSTGDIALIGGFDGTGPSGMEWARPSGDDALVSEALTAGLPAGIEPTAFASVAVVRDDGREASLLVLGGNPLPSVATAYADPGRANVWLLEVDGDGQTYEPASARTRAVSGAGDWAVRSLAGLVRAGDRFFLFGGFRSFNALAGVAGCGDGGPVWGAYCFPRTIQQFSLDVGDAKVVPHAVREDVRSRLGVAALVLPGGWAGQPERAAVLLIGGLDGFGTRPSPLPADFDPLLSTGLIFVPEDALDPASCRMPSVH